MLHTSALFMAQEEEKPNFLLPNATIFVEALIFAVVLFVMWRYIVPPVRTAMRERREMVQRQIDESKKADEKFAAAEARHREALAEARAEAGKIRDTARAEGQKALDDLRGQASAEVARLRREGDEQLAAQRDQVVRDLEPQIVTLSQALASRIVGEKVTAGGRKR
jgi:F-type H+-transporting ATPase subunit b